MAAGNGAWGRGLVRPRVSLNCSMGPRGELLPCQQTVRTLYSLHLFLHTVLNLHTHVSLESPHFTMGQPAISQVFLPPPPPRFIGKVIETK